MKPKLISLPLKDFSRDSSERAYECCLYEITLHPMRAVSRDVAELYGSRKIVTIEEME
jgi:hypothetical protein